MTEAVRDAEDVGSTPIAVEVVRLWADLDERRRIRTYRASVKVAYRVALLRP